MTLIIFIKFKMSFGKSILKVIDIGIKEDTSDYLVNKIKISNSIAIVLSIWLYVPFTVICLLFFQDLIMLPVVATVLSLSTIGLNYLKYYNLSRIIVSLTGISADVLFHSFTVSPGDDYISIIFLIQFLFILIPLVLFSLKELKLLIFTSIAAFLIYSSVLIFSNILIFELDTTILRSGLFFNILVIAMPFTIYGVVLPFLLSERESERRTIDLLNLAKSKEKEAKTSELELQAEIEKMKLLQDDNEKRKLLDTQRDWSVQGIARFNDILRSDTENIADLSFAIIKELVKYMKVNQGGLFFLTDDDDKEKYLELQASIAFDRQKFNEKKILAGEGLVGTCFLEKKTIFLKKVPQNYIRITSGLGGENPSFLLIVPMLMNNQVLGVIELASFKEIEKYKIEFVEKLGESIASSLSMARINARTKMLVEELKMKAEQQSAQEEEMIQNVEELRATQEESQRKEQELYAELEKARKEIKLLKSQLN